MTLNADSLIRIALGTLLEVKSSTAPPKKFTASCGGENTRRHLGKVNANSFKLKFELKTVSQFIQVNVSVNSVDWLVCSGETAGYVRLAPQLRVKIFNRRFKVEDSFYMNKKSLDFK